MRRWIQNSPVAVGVAFILIGILVVFLGWNGAASKDYVEGQIPYLISGGVGGLITVAAGASLILVQTRRRDNAELLARLDEIAGLLRESGLQSPTGPMIVPEGAEVLAGQSTYHVPGCRIVEGRGDFRPMTVEAAEAKGLDACRICQPDAASA